MKNIKLNAFPVYDDQYVKTKIEAYDDKVYTRFHGWNVSGKSVKCKYFTVFLLIF